MALAALFTVAWTIRDRANLAVLRLPDTDDVVRLQQVRDWLGGQGWRDLVQHRLGIDGVPMHWTRLADLGPGGLIALLTPLVGRHAAELSAVIAWPAILFAAALVLTARIARRLDAPPATAQLVAALGFPVSAMFLPGRIDHHGLQLVLLLAMVAAALAPPRAVTGGAIALAATASLVVGMETAPFVALAVGLVVANWATGRPGAARQLAGLGAALLGGLLLAAVVFAPAAWTYPACDGFTRQVWAAGLVGGVTLLMLAGIGRNMMSGWPHVLLTEAVGGVAAVVALALAPGCVDPYGGVDAAVAARWLRHVGEAQSPFAASLATVVGQCGLMLAGIAATAWLLMTRRHVGWGILLAFQLGALAIALVQLRGANAGALLAAPALAATIAAARTRGTIALTAAWAGSAGILYPLAAQALLTSAGAPEPPDCASPAVLAALDRLPPGRIAGPVDLGAWGIAATHHRFLAAPYHRNRGNAAAFAILDGPAARALTVARATRTDYLAICGPGPGWIMHDRPRWLHAVLTIDGFVLYRIDRLPEPVVPT